MQLKSVLFLLYTVNNGFITLTQLVNQRKILATKTTKYKYCN